MAKCGYYLRSTLACGKTQSEHLKIRCHVTVTQ